MARFSSMGKKTFSGRKPYILFLCTGNTCRSPMAQGVLKHFMEEEGIHGVDVRTAGVMTIPGLMPTQECRQLLLKDGVDISGHRSCQMNNTLIDNAILILGMTSFHVQMALRASDHAKGKTFLLKEYTGSDAKNGQIQDPMGCTLEVYKKVYREIKSCCKKMLKTKFLQEYKKRSEKPATRTLKKPVATSGQTGSTAKSKPATKKTTKKTTKKSAKKTAKKKTSKKTSKKKTTKK